MSPTLEEEIGHRLRKIRKLRNLTQKELSERIQGRIDYSYIGKIERGEQLPSLKVLRKIGDALGVHLGYFFQKEEWVELLPEELKRIAKDEARRALLKGIAGVHREDIPLLAEIIRVLERHRQVRKEIKPPLRKEAVIAADRGEPYRGVEERNRIKGALIELEKALIDIYPPPEAEKTAQALSEASRILRRLLEEEGVD